MMPSEKQKNIPRPAIWKYSDYRVYLNDCVLWKKSKDKKFSYSYFAKALGTTKSYLKLVTSRKRNISLDKVIQTSKLFQHSLLERQYFIFLFLENQSEDEEVKIYFKSILKNFTPAGQPRNPVVEIESEKKYEAMRNWVMLSVCGLAACEQYQHNVDWVHRQLGGDSVISRPQVQEAMDRLVENKVLEKKNDRWKVSVNSEMRSAHPLDFDQAQAYKTGLVRSLLAVDLLGQTNVHDPKLFFMNVIAVNEKDQQKVLSLFEDFRKRLWDVTHDSVDPSRVMLISNNLISLNGK